MHGLLIGTGGVSGAYYGITGGGIKVPELTTSGGASPTVSVVVADYYRIKITGTGGYAADGTAYDAFCVPNPLGAIDSTLTGHILEAHLMIDNHHSPTQVIDIGFVDDCGVDGKSSSGNQLFKNVGDGVGNVGTIELRSGSGAQAFTGNTIVDWPPSGYSGSKLKGTISGPATASGFTARLNLKVVQGFEKIGN